jgi:hypothetical protein
VATAGPRWLFFSFAAHEGDTLYFTCIGYTPVQYLMPAKLESDKFFDNTDDDPANDLNLPATIIYPWGPPENFPRAFLDLNLPDDDIQRAKRNMDRERLAALGERLEQDGGEATSPCITKYIS